MKKILITNDDGIEADGIIRLAEAAKRFGEVWVVAPDGQRSAMSHKITLREHIDVYEDRTFPVPGVHAYRSTGTPADCVRFGRLNIVGTNPDLVLSGINYGFNAGTDTQYSATVGAALEAACEGIHAIALSEGACDCHEVTDAFLEQIIEEYMERPLEFNQIWNVNFPQCPMSSYRGILTERIVAPNGFYKDHYDEVPLPDGGRRLTVNGIYHEEAAEGTDFKALVEGYISISKIHNIH